MNNWSISPPRKTQGQNVEDKNYKHKSQSQIWKARQQTVFLIKHGRDWAGHHSLETTGGQRKKEKT